MGNWLNDILENPSRVFMTFFANVAKLLMAALPLWLVVNFLYPIGMFGLGSMNYLQMFGLLFVLEYLVLPVVKAFGVKNE